MVVQTQRSPYEKLEELSETPKGRKIKEAMRKMIDVIIVQIFYDVKES